MEDNTGPAADRRGDADLAAAAALIADPARARVLTALLDGRALPASGLAAEAGLSAPATSAHLNKLRAGGLVEVEVSGRHRYYRLTGSRVAAALEALAAIAPLQPVRSLRQDTHAGQLRAARSCYDHLAGRLGVAVTAALLSRRVLTATDGIDDTVRRAGDRLAATLPAHPYQLGPAAEEVLGELGVDLAALTEAPRPARPLLRFCTDWTEQRHHLAGGLGAALLTALCDRGCLVRRPRRVVWVTDRGAAILREQLGVDVPPSGSAGHGWPPGNHGL
ncbi:MAG TPA: winged helix-turn-helix domain-containing protein [Trebonia sp.]|nr:winged helix-turn-helix domain-containing protein [Trebonia sp.]